MSYCVESGDYRFAYAICYTLAHVEGEGCAQSTALFLVFRWLTLQAFNAAFRDRQKTLDFEFLFPHNSCVVTTAGVNRFLA